MGIRTPVFAVRGRRLRPLDHGGTTAELGFEPRMNESESLVLPLHHSASFSSATLLQASQQQVLYHSRGGMSIGFFTFFWIFFEDAGRAQLSIIKRLMTYQPKHDIIKERHICHSIYRGIPVRQFSCILASVRMEVKRAKGIDHGYQRWPQICLRLGHF